MEKTESEAGAELELPSTAITEAVSSAPDLKPPLDVVPQPPERSDAALAKQYAGQPIADIVNQLLEAREPMQDPYANAARAKLFEAERIKVPLEDNATRDQLQVKAAHENLRAGNYDTAAIDLTEWLGDSTPPEDLASLSPDQRTAWQLLATAELRRAMTAISENADPLTLAFPPEDALEEVDRESLATAEGIFRVFAEANATDGESRWLLNLAAIVADTYPDSVPEGLEIPDLLDKKTAQFPEFTRLFIDQIEPATSLAWAPIHEDGSDLIRLGTDGLRVFQGGGEIDLTDSLGLAEVPGGIHVSTADIDNDGLQEILILRDDGFPNSLLRREDGVYVDITETAGLLAFANAKSAAWADFDRDGLIDLAIANGEEPLSIYRNLGRATFTDITWQIGLSGRAADRIAWSDLDGDGWSDLIVSALGHPIEVWRGLPAEGSGHWRFADMARALGIEAIGGGPIWTWDFDNDGATDFGCVADGKITVFRNTEDGFSFIDLTSDLDLDLAVGDIGTALVGDIDNDGFPDLFLGTGGETLAALEPNRLFWNRGGDRFREVTAASGFGLLEKTPTAVFADLGGDADLDLIAGMGSRYESDAIPPVRFDNPGFEDHRFLRVRFDPPVGASRDGIGTRLHLTVRDEDWILNEIHFTVTTPGPQLIGLGRAKQIESLIIEWPILGALPITEQVPPLPDSEITLPRISE